MIIVFDLWGTLGTKNASFSKALQEHFRISFSTREYEEALQLVCWGSMDAMAKHFLEVFGLPVTHENKSFVVKAQEECLMLATPYEHVRRLIEHLRQEGHTIVLLSNSTFFEAQIIVRWGFDTLFDETIFPFETRVIKPDEKSYLLMCARVGCKPSDCLFVDDTANNCLAARAIGMRTHQFIDVATLETYLREEKIIH